MDLAFPRASHSLSLISVVELEGPRNRLGAVSCKGSRALAMAAHWLGPGLEGCEPLPIPNSMT